MSRHHPLARILARILALALLFIPALAWQTDRHLAAHRRQTEDVDYADAVCRPPVLSASAIIPPCTNIETIEVLCSPNGTEPLYLEAHAQCMCGGSFFVEWLGCQACLEVHGLRSPQQIAFYSSVITSASNALCTGTPTAPFNSLFSSAEVAATPVTTGETARSDRFPNQTAVSLYFTPSGPQGPGRITGAATEATNTGLMTAPARTQTTTTPTTTTTNGSNPFRTQPTGGVATTATTSTPNAAPAQSHVIGGAMMGAAAVALVAVL